MYHRAIVSTLGAFSLALLPIVGSAAQITVAEINPTRSTLDAADPDGATGGRINGLARTRQGTTFYAASEWGGLYKSTDAGRVWRRLDSHLPVATWDVEVDPTDSTRVYAASWYDGRVNSVAGISVSTDGGRSWVRPATATPAANFCAAAAASTEPSAFGIAIDPSNAQNVYVGTNCGLAASNNFGLTWRFIDPTPADGADNIWDVVVHRGIIDLCGDDGHQRSTDGGTTWTTAALVGLPAGRCSLAVSPDEAYVLLAVAGVSIFETDDGGATWPNQLVNPRPQGRIPFVATNQRTGATFDLWFGDVQLHRASCTTPTPAAQGGNVRCPANTWVGPFTRTAGGHDDAGDIAFDPRSASDACPMLFSSDGGVYRNTLTTSPACHSPAWEQPDTTPRGLWVFGMDGADQTGTTVEDLYFGNQDNGTFASTNAGSTLPTWDNRDCCDGFDVSAAPARVLYTVCCFAGTTRLFLRNQGMVGGGAIVTNPPGNLAGFRAPDIIDRFGPDDYVIITSTGVYVTQDITVNPIVWTQLGAATNPAGAVAVKAAVQGGTPTFVVQVGAGDGRGTDRLWTYTGTAPGGAWQQVNRPGGVGGFGIFDVDPTNPARLFVSYRNGNNPPAMLLSADGGANWAGLPGLDDLMTGGGAFQYRNTRGPTDFTAFGGYPQPTLVAFDPEDRNLLVAGAADAGLFLSVNNGTTWVRVSDPFNPCCSGKPHIPRPRFAYFDHEPRNFFFNTANAYIGTQGRGLWRVSLRRQNLFTLCRITECPHVQLDVGRIVFDVPLCVREPCQIFVDSVPKNCTLKFSCPGCERGLCPPFFHMFFDDLDPRLWNVALFREDGELAEFRLFRTPTGIALSFQPTRESYRDRRIGNYILAFSPRRGVPAGRHVTRTRLEVGERHFDLGEPLQPEPPEPSDGP